MKTADANLKVLIAILLLLGLSLSIMAQPPRSQRNQHNDRSGLEMLKLSDDQKAEIKKLHLEQLKDIQPLKDEMTINKAKINAMVNKDNPNMKEIVGLVEANGKILTEIQVKNIEKKIKLRALLNEDQKIIFDSQDGNMQKRKSMARYKFRNSEQGRRRL